MHTHRPLLRDGKIVIHTFTIPRDFTIVNIEAALKRDRHCEYQVRYRKKRQDRLSTINEPLQKHKNSKLNILSHLAKD